MAACSGSMRLSTAAWSQKVRKRTVVGILPVWPLVVCCPSRDHGASYTLGMGARKGQTRGLARQAAT